MNQYTLFKLIIYISFWPWVPDPPLGTGASLEHGLGVSLSPPPKDGGTIPGSGIAAAFRRHLRPLDADEARQGLEGARRRLGPGDGEL